jgi:hypothetical protein
MVECSSQSEYIKEIELTQAEATLYKKLIQKNRIQDSLIDENLSEIMMYLFILIQRRNAIPEIRMVIFTDPDYAEHKKNSPKKYFENKGLYGSNMLRHPDFLQYLKYFISGPDLPKKFIARFCESLEKESELGFKISQGFLKTLQISIRRFNLSIHQCSTEVFRLALEIGFKKEESLIIRRNAMNALNVYK